jgi:pyrroloquinoline-quinone synthase
MDIATTSRPLAGLPAWTPAEFEAQLREKGRSYHIHHPFNVRMNAGGCTPDELRCWVANRFYYQICIPRKDAAILANMPDRAHRRLWIERILDHDGHGDYGGSAAGGIEAWTRLGEAVGLSREDLWSLQGVVPAVRFACDAYVNFAARAPWQEAVCSSLTEMFAPQIHKDRLATWPTHYPWIEAEGLSYFRMACRSRWSTSTRAPRSTARSTSCSSSSTSSGPCWTRSKGPANERHRAASRA